MQINYESLFTMQRNENFYGMTSAILIFSISESEIQWLREYFLAEL